MACKKRSKVKDLKVDDKEASKVRGGLNPQPEPPAPMDHISLTKKIDPVINPSERFKPFVNKKF